MDLADYERIKLGIPFETNPRQWASTLSRRDAIELYDALMAIKEERKNELRKLVSPLDLECTEDQIEALNDWFLEHLESREDKLTVLSPDWYSIGFDVGFFIGDCLISATESLEWELNKRKKFIGEHLPALSGFKNSEIQDYYLDLINRIWAIGEARLRIVNHDRIRDKLNPALIRSHDKFVAKWRGKEQEYGRGKFLDMYNQALERA